MNIHVSLTFKTVKDPELIPFGQGVHDGLVANAATFPTLPVTAAALQTAVTDFTNKYNASRKGSEAQTVAKNTSRTTLVGQLAQLAAYVEGVAQGNADTIHKAGFDDVSHSHAGQTMLAKPSVDLALNFASGMIQLRCAAQPNVKSVHVQFRSGSGAWQDGGTFPSTRGVVVQDLMPGTTYDFRVQFIGGSSGASDWSDPVSHICT